MAEETINGNSKPLKDVIISWHAVSSDEILQKLDTQLEKGLTNQEAEKRLQEYGPNQLEEGKRTTFLQMVLRQLNNFVVILLIVASIISAFLGEWVDASAIIAIVILNTIMGVVQENRAEQALATLKKLAAPDAQVLRDGRRVTIPSHQLVPGDIVFLEAGYFIPADVRLLEAINLRVEEAALTGESVPVTKKVYTLPEDTPVSDQVNMAFAGTTVVRGITYGHVTSTGVCTEVGKIAVAVADTGVTKPPLIIRMEKFSQHIAIAVLFVSLLLGCIAIMQGMGIFDVFFFVVALAVSAIPEGLPVALTVVLSIATYRMSLRNVIIRKMTAVESLGSCTLIASDKTGTLTVNEQTAHALQLPGGEFLSISGTGYNGEGDITYNDGVPLPSEILNQVQRLCFIATLCSEARLDPEEEGWSHSGDPVDVAFFALARKAGLDTTELTRTIERPLFIPFEAERRYSAAGFIDGDNYRFGVKGAAEAVIPWCVSIRTEEGDIPVDRNALLASAEHLAEEGYRVLALAEAVKPGIPEEPVISDLPSLVLLGLIGFIDPVRPDARASVTACQKAGVTVVMVTGDHPATALAISKTLGIADNPSMVLTGNEIEEIGSFEVPEFFDKVEAARVFARVTPIQKLAIVDTFIRMGHFVAVTGDGVNDAPALRRAHIGVAMGSGTDIAKDNAAMIVTDDRFGSIVAGIEEGRFAYDNIRKVTYLLISTGAAEVILFTGSLVAALPLPLIAVQLLWLNLVTNGIQHVGLAFEPGEAGAMTRPPRPPGEGIFNRLMIGEVLVSSLVMGMIGFGVWYFLISSGYEENAARNLALLLFVFLENVHVFNCRSEYTSVFKMPLKRNLFLILAVIGAQAVHQISMHVPVLQEILGLQPVGMNESVILLVIAFVVVLVMELFKLIWPRIERRQHKF
ncbi:MAG: ATPase [Methanomicrobiales archaeon HGW-Methanomicrobiales-4]|nr:MAG: ATPase [Methanomicrobiales archaeon HGW-Methanomicrobiales-4]